MAKRNISEFNQDVRSNDGYRYTRNAPYSSRVANRRMTEAIRAALPAGVRTLVDIGCGDGTYTEELRAAFPAAKLTGLEAAGEAVASARKNFPEIDFAVFDLMDPATFPERTFQAAVLRGVVHHLPDAALGLAHAARLSPFLVIVEPNGNNPILKWIEKHSRYHIDHEEQSFTERQLRAWCGRAGLRVARLSYIGFVPFFFPAWPARLVHFFQPLLEKAPLLARYFGAQIVLECELGSTQDT